MVRVDFYTKIILTAIAAGLILNLYRLTIGDAGAQQSTKALAVKEAVRVMNETVKRQKEFLTYSRNIVNEVKNWTLSAPRATALLIYATVEQNDILMNLNSNILRILLIEEEEKKS